jgi:lipoate-protein ligase A
MEPAAKNGDSMQKTRADCIANLKNLYPDIKSGDMATIVNSIFKLLQVTDKVEAQHTKKRAPRKRSEKQKENQHEKNEKKKAERLQREEQARQTPPAADQQKQATTEESSEKAAEKPQRMYDARPYHQPKM